MPQMIQVISGPLEGIAFRIHEEQMLRIGRSHQNDMMLKHDPWLSGSHGILRRAGSNLALLDLGSSNGSFVAGKKVSPNKYIDVDSYFVVGSTLCRVSGANQVVTGEALPVSSSNLEHIVHHPIVRDAIKLVRHRKAPMLDTLHLFIACMDLPEITEFLAMLNYDSRNLKQRLQKLQVFEGTHAWLNEFLYQQYKIPHSGESLVTPMVQAILNDQDFDYIEPTHLLQTMLTQHFNLLFPLFDLNRTRHKLLRSLGKLAQRHKEKLTTIRSNSVLATMNQPLPIPEPVHTTKNAFEKHTANVHAPPQAIPVFPVLSNRFGNLFEQKLESHGVLVLAGKRGIGKSGALHQMMQRLAKRKPLGRFDPKSFYRFHEEHEFSTFLDSLYQELASHAGLCIDHFELILDYLTRDDHQRNHLFGLINQRASPTVIVLQESHLSFIDEYCPENTCLHLEQFLMEPPISPLERFFQTFKNNAQYSLSAEAKAFLKEHLAKRNPLFSNAFLNYCTNQLKQLHSHPPTPQLSTSSLSRSFFELMWREWYSPSPSRSPKLARASANLASPQTDTEFAALIENSLHRFLQQNLNLNLSYPDQSRSICEHRSLSLIQKKETLHARLTIFFESLSEAFPQWFEAFLKELDPKMIESNPRLKGNAPALWKDFVYRYELMDAPFAQDHFMEMLGKVYQEKLHLDPHEFPPQGE